MEKILSLLTSIYQSCSSYFYNAKGSFLKLNNHLVADLPHFKENASVFKVFKDEKTEDCRHTFLNYS